MNRNITKEMEHGGGNVASLFKKLRLDNSQHVLIVNAPDEFLALVRNLPHDTSLRGQKGTYDYVQIFTTSKKELEALCKQYSDAGKHDCLFWICYPKGSGSIKSDLQRERVWEAAAGIGLKTVTQVAIDETWSAMRLRPWELVGK